MLYQNHQQDSMNFGRLSSSLTPVFRMPKPKIIHLESSLKGYSGIKL